MSDAPEQAPSEWPGPARAAKRDRLARFYRVVSYLAAHRDGVPVETLADFVGMSRRTVYRDLVALQDEIGIPLWSEDGRWGVLDSAFLPPLSLTLDEAVAFFLAARLTAQFADRYDPDTGAAFQKLAAILPPQVARHMERTIDVLARRPHDERATRNLRLLARAWAERRVVEFNYAAAHRPGAPVRRARVRPYLIEASSATRAVYLLGFDEGRGGIRTFKLQRIMDLSMTPQRFEAAEADDVQDGLTRAWGLIADQEEVEVVLRFDAALAGQIRETTWHPTELTSVESDGSIVWRATVPGTIEIRRWILSWGSGVEVVAPVDLRDDIGATLRAAAARY